MRARRKGAAGPTLALALVAVVAGAALLASHLGMGPANAAALRVEGGAVQVIVVEPRPEDVRLPEASRSPRAEPSSSPVVPDTPSLPAVPSFDAPPPAVPLDPPSPGPPTASPPAGKRHAGLPSPSPST